MCLQGELGEVAFLHKAMSLGFVVAKPYGNIRRYDFIVEGGTSLWRVQVKACGSVMNGLYQMCTRRRVHGVALAYAKSDFNFLAAYIIPEDAWFILPAYEVVGHRSLLFRPTGFQGRDPYMLYRDAWHLFREPDGIVIG